MTPRPRVTSGRRRIGIVTPYYPPSLGGVQLYAERLARRLAETDDLSPLVITTADPPGVRGHRQPVGPGRSRQDGVDVVRLRPLLRLSNTPVNPLWFRTARRLITRERIALLHTHAPVPYLADVFAASAGDIPLVSTYHAGSMIKGDSRWDGLLRSYERWVLPRVLGRADVPVAVSSTSLADRLPGAVRISPGVDLDRFAPPKTAGHRPPTLLYVGRLDRSSAWKGVDVLLAAFAEVVRCRPHARLRIVGDGDARRQLQALAGRLGVSEQTDWSGVLTGPDLVAAYREASALVLPSRSESESFGMTLIEAMACATPVIGSAVGGITSVIEDGRTGRLVTPGDPQALSAAAVDLLDDPARAAVLGRRGRQSAELRFGWQQRLDQYLEIYRRLLDRDLTSSSATPRLRSDTSTQDPRNRLNRPARPPAGR